MPDLVAAFRSGGEVPWSAYGRDMVEAQGDFNRPWLVGSLGTEYLPSIPELDARLAGEPGAKVADVACGVGWAAISLARAYPNITVDGFDLDETSIEMASRNAEEAGVADRVRFEARDGAAPGMEGRYDLAIVVESIHDLSQPIAVLRAIREMLKPGGTLIVADERTEESFTAPASETERLFYAYSVLCCLPSAMDDHTLGGDRDRHATDDLPEVREGRRLRRGLGHADRTRLPPLLSPRPLSPTLTGAFPGRGDTRR